MNRFARTRRDHAGERAEDYVEMVRILLRESGRARVTDLAARLGVRSATVTQTVRRLAEEGLLEWAPYRSIALTPKGEQVALESEKRHKLLIEFLVMLGVDRETAEHDAEGMEHHISRQTLEAMQRELDGPRRGGQTGRE